MFPFERRSSNFRRTTSLERSILPLLALKDRWRDVCWLLPSVHRILLPLLLEIRDVPCSCLTLCVIALGTSVRKIGALRTMEQVSLPNHVKCEYNQRGPFCSYFLATRLFLGGEVQFVLSVFISIKQRVCFSFHAFQERVSRWIKPRTISLVLGTLTDLTRGKPELLAENALLRHQLIILRRHIKRPVCRQRDRLLLVLLARMVRTWKQTLFLVQPETLLRLPS